MKFTTHTLTYITEKIYVTFVFLNNYKLKLQNSKRTISKKYLLGFDREML